MGDITVCVCVYSSATLDIWTATMLKAYYQVESNISTASWVFLRWLLFLCLLLRIASHSDSREQSGLFFKWHISDCLDKRPAQLLYYTFIANYWIMFLCVCVNRRGLLVDHPPCVQAEIRGRESPHRRRPDSCQRVNREIPGMSCSVARQIN